MRGIMKNHTLSCFIFLLTLFTAIRSENNDIQNIKHIIAPLIATTSAYFKGPAAFMGLAALPCHKVLHNDNSICSSDYLTKVIGFFTLIGHGCIRNGLFGVRVSRHNSLMMGCGTAMMAFPETCNKITESFLKFIHINRLKKGRTP